MTSAQTPTKQCGHCSIFPLDLPRGCTVSYGSGASAPRPTSTRREERRVMRKWVLYPSCEEQNPQKEPTMKHGQIRWLLIGVLGLMLWPCVVPAQGASHVRQAQERLKAAGFDPGPIDGIPGPQSEAALRQYQAAHGFPVTGKLDEATRTSLMPGQAMVKPPRPCPGGLQDCPPRPWPSPEEVKKVLRPEEVKKVLRDPRKEIEEAMKGAMPVVVPPPVVAPRVVLPPPVVLPSPVVVPKPTELYRPPEGISRPIPGGMPGSIPGGRPTESYRPPEGTSRPIPGGMPGSIPGGRW